MARNYLSNGAPRLGRPPGPSKDRSHRPWDQFNEEVLRFVHSHPDTPRYLIAAVFDISPSKLSTITCSPRGVAFLARLKSLDEVEQHASTSIEYRRAG